MGTWCTFPEVFFFFLESIRLISLRLCGAPVPSPSKVRYTHGKTCYINVLPSDPKKCPRRYPSSAATLATGLSPIKVCLLHHAPSSPSPYIYDSSTSTPLTDNTVQDGPAWTISTTRRFPTSATTGFYRAKRAEQEYLIFLFI